jgi:hypothetical protein
MDIQQYFENSKKDNTLSSTINIDELLKDVEKHPYLENNTMSDIEEAKLNAIQKINADNEKKQEWITKLNEYRYINDLHEFIGGKYIRWITKDDEPTLKNGGIFNSIKFTNTGTILTLCIFGKRIINVKYDNHIFFQKMSKDEIMILTMFEDLVET